MNWVVEATLAGVTAFAATNIDDIVVLTLFFAKVDEVLRRRHIVTGQYLGFLVILAASLPGFLGGMVVSKEWLGWLGLLPIVIGLRHLLQPETDELDIQTIPFADENSATRFHWQSRLKSIFSPQTYQVAAVTIANGGDNIGIYVPLFANSTLASLGIILAVFLVMIAVWCVIANQLASHPFLAQTLTRYGDRLVPFVLIGLGIFILIDSETYQLFIR